MKQPYLNLTFDEVVVQHEAMIYYHLHKLCIIDNQEDFYQEGLCAMWEAYQKYRPDKGLLGTYFNSIIRNRLIDLIRKRTRDKHNNNIFYHEESKLQESGNRCRNGKLPISSLTDSPIKDTYVWEQVKSKLTINQWKWIQFHIVMDMPIKEIAMQEGVTIDAVKSWARQTKKKLMNEPIKEMIMDSL
ncbi:RNA polymerase sigma factor (sigma-70 family) [Virgibacillus natechei]|uniref:RNA polymerase sigma factor (Sigma-70 family) n=1 Tax=Virgibacillus natechei TaxID=1216297 RepID=A0ABS4IMX4_9BACI|nr:sigma-70 family RNA polymerase sigma factor [Virgibacillus natechei]MBP1971349.1 RNA polymerase sigma factor (sigma-70 family) [Virgibacillus natechei]UZD12916.1 sigma-70 family RNA polymerase sigma factor [Virgibacillus natechei]